MKKILYLLLALLPLSALAQTEAKYLEGAVPVKDGKVLFTTEMNVPTLTQQQIYETLTQWAANRFKPDDKFNARILYSNHEDGEIAIAGEEYIVFTSSALSLDRSRIYYHLIINADAGKCNVEMKRIRYWYEENRNGGERIDAEERILDELTINKKKNKLYPIYGKFRMKTIDLKDELFKEIQTALGDKLIALGHQSAPVRPESHVQIVTAQPVQAAQPVQTVVQPIQQAQPVQPAISAANDMESLIAQSVRMTITAGNDEQFEISKECWGGFGELFGKKVAFCLIDSQKTMGNMLMSQSDNYKISFFPANNSQAAVIINCKKLMTQNINGEEAQKMNPSCEVGKTYNMYVGEILK